MVILNDNTILQYLDSLLKYKSFTKASEDLYISQPYLTQVVKKTEKHIGVKIIDCGNNQIRLTKAGCLYYKYLIENVEHTNNFINQLNEFNQKRTLSSKSACCRLSEVFFCRSFFQSLLKTILTLKSNLKKLHLKFPLKKPLKDRSIFISVKPRQRSVHSSNAKSEDMNLTTLWFQKLQNTIIPIKNLSTLNPLTLKNFCRKRCCWLVTVQPSGNKSIFWLTNSRLTPSSFLRARISRRLLLYRPKESEAPSFRQPSPWTWMKENTICVLCRKTSYRLITF